MKYQKILAVASAIVLLGAGCGKPASNYVAERSVEKMIEKQTGAKVDIKQDGNAVKYETKEGVFESGTDLKLPEDFPKDVYVAEGKIVSAISNKDNGVFSVSIESEAKAEDLAKTYENKFKDEGWKISGTMNFGDTYSVIAEKEGRQASAMIGQSSDNTTIVLSVGKK